MSPIQTASTFIIKTLFDLYLLLLLLRLILQYLRVDYYNPLTQFIIKLTNPVVVPLRRYIPGYFGLDLATVLVILGLTCIKLCLLSLILRQQLPHVSGLVIWSFAEIVESVVKLFFYAILLQIILSWVQPRSHNPVTIILFKLTDPLLRPARRFIPPLSGFDLSPIPVMMVLYLFSILFTQPLTQLGMQLALRK